jgi:hypothetical protein
MVPPISPSAVAYHAIIAKDFLAMRLSHKPANPGLVCHQERNNSNTSTNAAPHVEKNPHQLHSHIFATIKKHADPSKHFINEVAHSPLKMLQTNVCRQPVNKGSARFTVKDL